MDFDISEMQHKEMRRRKIWECCGCVHINLFYDFVQHLRIKWEQEHFK